MSSVVISHRYKQSAYAFHQALHISMYHKSLDTFETIFKDLVPKDMAYKIELIGSHEYPRLRRYRVNVHKGRMNFDFDETMIEERLDE